MKRKTNFLLAVLLCLLPVLAIARQAKMDPFDLHVASLRILERKDVQAELGVTTQQRATMDKYADEYNTKLNAYLAELKKEKKTVTLPDETVVTMLGNLKQQVMAVLTSAQLKRLREISLQAFGLNGILDSTVAKKVGLSDTQIKRMRSLYEEGSKKANSIMTGAEKPVQQKYKGKPTTDQNKKAYESDSKAAMQKVMPTVQKINDDTQAAMLKVFTAAQKQKYLSLQGKVFHSKAARP
jgi:hypothetical protein